MNPAYFEAEISVTIIKRVFKMDTVTKNKFIAAAIVFAVYKFVPNNAVKAMALGVAGVMVGAYVPYINGKAIGEA